MRRQAETFAGSVDIGGGRKMYLECSGLGTPTVVLNAGLRASADDWSIAAKPGPTVSPEVAKFTRVCACDLPGTPHRRGAEPERSRGTNAGNAFADLHAGFGHGRPVVTLGIYGHMFRDTGKSAANAIEAVLKR